MNTVEIGIFVALLAIVTILVYVFLVRKEDIKESSDGLLMLQQQLQDLTKTVDERMTESNRAMQEGARSQSRESRELIQEINKEVNEQLRNVVKGVSEVSESSKQVFSVAEQLQNLEKVLKHQKQRGNLGEASLQLALENMLPATAYKPQYQFPGGETVDAVIITKDGMIPVDAKFSLDNYRRLVDETDEAKREVLEDEFKKDLKKRIDETAKYIRPKDGTLPFAFMYIPAEAIYYDLLVNEVGSVKVNTRSLIDYAYKDKNVIIVSPTTFAAYLQSVLYGFRAFKIEESAKQIGKHVESLSRHLKAYDDYFKKVGNSLSTTVNHYNAAQKELGKVDKDVVKITGDTMDIEPVTLEKPQETSE
ncbi:MAG: DNA recombination protein RmuC [Candidatus Pacebacteria bacterium]|nr:DNA recombination protein RmuC [Candidatus Paceibacterota bacterium]MCF7857127.1 DNA recombination protein RmuC [Candidatus Paceibacterota bacterium]